MIQEYQLASVSVSDEKYKKQKRCHMAIEDISNLFKFLGGLGMFLYGMNIMGDGMQKTAGS